MPTLVPSGSRTTLGGFDEIEELLDPQVPPPIPRRPHPRSPTTVVAPALEPGHLFHITPSSHLSVPPSILRTDRV